MDAATTQANQAAPAAPEDTSPNNFSRLTSPTVGKVALALAKAQGAFLQLSKNCEGRVSYEGKDGKPGGSYVFHYADLSAVVDATREALAANELAVINMAQPKLGILRVALLHSSGEWLASDGLVPNASQVGPQRYGSALTYSKRYQLSGLLGVAADDDDDANAAEGNQLQKTEKPRGKAPEAQGSSWERGEQPGVAKAKPAKPEADPVHTAKVTALAIAMKGAGITEEDRLTWCSLKLGKTDVIKSSKELTVPEIDKLMAELNKGASGGAA